MLAVRCACKRRMEDLEADDAVRLAVQKKKEQKDHVFICIESGNSASGSLRAQKEGMLSLCLQLCPLVSK